jgi:integrase
VPARNKQSYEPFSSDELIRLFSSPGFNRGERPRGGSGDAAYWFPLIALYSGARRTEIVQLRVSDIRTSPGGLTFFDFTTRLRTRASRLLPPLARARDTSAGRLFGA